jgi:hypothetical protein
MRILELLADVLPFTIGDTVYLKVRIDRLPGMVVSMHIFGQDSLAFSVNWGDGESTEHYHFELSDEFVAEYT